jgi:hypothetical protein
MALVERRPPRISWDFLDDGLEVRARTAVLERIPYGFALGTSTSRPSVDREFQCVHAFSPRPSQPSRLWLVPAHPRTLPMRNPAKQPPRAAPRPPPEGGSLRPAVFPPPEEASAPAESPSPAEHPPVGYPLPAVFCPPEEAPTPAVHAPEVFPPLEAASTPAGHAPEVML